MNPSTKQTRAEIVFLVLILLIGALVAFEGWRLPVSRFEPLGAGAFPLGIGALLMMLAALGLVQKLRGRDIGRAETALILGVGETDAESTHRRRPGLALFTLAALALYCVTLQATPVGFMWATMALVAVLGVAMANRFDARTIGLMTVVGIGAGAALTFVFGTLLRLVLP